MDFIIDNKQYHNGQHMIYWNYSKTCLKRQLKNRKKLEKVSMGHGCPRLLFLFHLQLNIGYTIGGFVLPRYLMSISFCSN